MEQIKIYLFRLVTAAILCGLLTRFLDNKGPRGSLIKLVTGLFMVLVLLQPLSNLRIGDLTGSFGEFTSEAQIHSHDGMQLADAAWREGIIERTRTYILDKAAVLKTDLTVEVTLSEDEFPVPAAAKLTGKVSPYAKTVLSQMLTDELGIEKEKQTWICW